MENPGSVPARRRSSAETVRRCQLRLRLSPAELTAVKGAARADGLAAGAWVGQIAVRFARGETEPLPMTWRELLGELVRFRAEVVGLSAVFERVTQAENSDGSGIGDGGDAVRERVRRLDEAITLALATEQFPPRGPRRTRGG